MKVGHIGTKSFSLHYELNIDKELYTRGISVQVCYDSISNMTIPIPEKMLEALNKLNKIV
jgi:acyl-CoA thioesterase FadM